MCSSARYSVGSPFFPFTVTGTTSSWNTHASQACLARCWDARATSSTSFRVSLYFSARPSAVSAMDRPHCGSLSASQRRSSSGAEVVRRQVLQRAPERAKAGPQARQKNEFCIGTLGLHWGETPRETRGISGGLGGGGRAGRGDPRLMLKTRYRRQNTVAGLSLPVIPGLKARARRQCAPCKGAPPAERALSGREKTMPLA